MKEPLEVSVGGGDYTATLEQLVADRVASRIAAQDSTLWGEDARSEAEIRLSWVGLHETSRPLLAEIDALRAELWGEGIDRVVLCGMGGSSLAPEVISRTFGCDLVVLDSTAPTVLGRALAGDLERTVVVVSSKSGGTLETDSQRRAFVQAFAEAGIDPASRLVVVTDPGSPLSDMARGAGYRKVFHADPHVGGRYSALTAFGLVPCGLAGVDVADLLDEADEVAERLAADEVDNPALRLGAWLGGTDGRDKALLADTDSGIVGFPDWAEQLIAESTGKRGLGVLPVALPGESAPEVDQAAADVLLGLLVPVDQAGGTGEGPEVAVNGIPTARVSGPLGAQFLVWETAVAVAGRLLGINPFDQPDVESAKAAARGLLDAQPEPEAPRFVDGSVEVRSGDDLLDGVDSLTGAVDAVLSRLGDDGYVAVMAYLDPEEAGDLYAVRDTLAHRSRRPVTFGWGPRFLHSTGQYHKGGPPKGVFIQVTADQTGQQDVDIPDRPFTFGTLIAAQADGDAHVLAEHGRPILRLHLTELKAGLQQLQGALR
ncbi:MAG TPA: glucose-6-phosphate isomerase [Nocardioidaceae bacterium]|nr:glucose-6-phosphate isomerase [Nocardioidaceae bacterium]